MNNGDKKLMNSSSLRFIIHNIRKYGKISICSLTLKIKKTQQKELN